MARVAINGFGRIGRLFLREVLGKRRFASSLLPRGGLDVVAINDLGDVENLAYLLKYDSVYGRWREKVEVKKGKLIVGGRKIEFLQIQEPTELPWKKLKIDLVVEATGVFESYAKARVHLDAGAKRAIITAPAKDEDSPAGVTVLMGVNEDELETAPLSSNGSCTTNAASPLIQILSENPGIEKAVLNTVHSYTATQNIVDGPIPHPFSKGEGRRDYRRGRAAAVNIVPSTTGAAIAVTRAVRSLKGKFDGIAMRVPIVAGSIADITFIAKRRTSVEEVNDILRKASRDRRWRNVFTVTEEPLVSSDILGEPYGAIADLAFTKVVDGNLVKVLSWYDNEFGYAATLVRHAEQVASLV